MAMEYDLLVVNGLVVTDTEAGEYDIAVKDEKIAAVAERGELKDAKCLKIIDAEGGYVMVRVFHCAETSPLTFYSQAGSMGMFIFRNLHYLERGHQRTTMKPVCKYVDVSARVGMTDLCR